MWHRIRERRIHTRQSINQTGSRLRQRAALHPLGEILEGRELMTASLAPLPDIAVPAQLGFQVALDGSGTTSPSQSFQATSSNPEISVSVAQGQFWTLTVSHAPASSSDVTINHETMTFQLFQDLTPSTVARITNLTNANYYTQGFPGQTPPVAAGQFIPRITTVASSGFAAIQGGSSSATSTASSSGVPPIATEAVQQLAFTGTNQIAMANTGAPNGTDAQFFITNGVPSTNVQQALDFRYTIFGQLVAGQQTVNDLDKVAVTTGSSGEKSQPITPVVINNVALSSANPNGVLHIDTTSARPGETANITVTATDPQDGSHLTMTFKVTVGAYNGPTDPPINFVPFAVPFTATTEENQPKAITLAGYSGYPGTFDQMFSTTLVSPPSHGTISQFNGLNDTLVYTPDPGFSGTDSFQFAVQALGTGVKPPPLAVSLPATVTIEVTAPSLVSVMSVQEMTNKRHQVTTILVQFSGPLDVTLAREPGIYRLALPGRKGSFTARNSKVIKLKSVVYDAASNTVRLIPRKPFSRTGKLQLRVDGELPSGLLDSNGRLIDGDHDGRAGGNAVVIMSRSGVNLNALLSATTIIQSSLR